MEKFSIITIQSIKYFVLDRLKNDFIYRYMLSKNEIFERELISHLMKYIIPSSVVVDIGSHIGNHSIQFAKRSKVVYAFEAMKQNCDIFKENMLLNNIGNVVLFNIACADQKCKLKIDKNTPENSGANFLIKDEDGTIPADSLDNMLMPILKDPVSVIKIDVEEMEYFALKGGCKLIEKYHPVIYTEIFRPRPGSEWKLESIRKILNPLGYTNQYIKRFSGDIWLS